MKLTRVTCQLPDLFEMSKKCWWCGTALEEVAVQQNLGFFEEQPLHQRRYCCVEHRVKGEERHLRQVEIASKQSWNGA